MLLDMTLTKLLIYMEYRESKNKEFSKYRHVILLPYASNVNNINQTEQLHVPIWIVFFAKEIRSIYGGLDHATFFTIIRVLCSKLSLFMNLAYVCTYILRLQ